MRDYPDYQSHPNTKLPIISGDQAIHRLNGNGLKNYLKIYTQKAQTANYETLLAMLDKLNSLSLNLESELYHWRQLTENNNETMRHLMRYDVYHMIEINQNYVVGALMTIERQFENRFSTKGTLEKLLPQWYSNE